MYFEHLPWRDAFVNTAMLLGGMGPVDPLKTDGGKVFAGLFALYSGLVFLVVGPAVDVKLSAMQAGMFGRPFAIRFGPATFVVATVVATGIGLMFLGGAG